MLTSTQPGISSLAKLVHLPQSELKILRKFLKFTVICRCQNRYIKCTSKILGGIL